MKTLALCLALLSLIGCTLTGSDADDCDDLTQRLERLDARVTTAIGDAEASDVAACRVIAYGDKPCGGPWTYLVYSTEASDEAEVQRLVGEYNRLDARRNAACELVSTCDLTPEPVAALEGGRCVADYGGD